MRPAGGGGAPAANRPWRDRSSAIVSPKPGPPTVTAASSGVTCTPPGPRHANETGELLDITARSLRHGVCLAAPREMSYARRRPENNTLHRVVRENVETLYAAIEAGDAGALPAFVRKEIESYLDCALITLPGDPPRSYRQDA
jgi:hypothetical protein